MTPDNVSAQQALRNSLLALQKGDQLGARRWAEKAANLDPLLEEPWLVLASIARPRASVAYLEQALRINPRSERAHQAMHQAVARLRKSTGQDTDGTLLGPTKPVRTLEANKPPKTQFKSTGEGKKPKEIVRFPPTGNIPSLKSVTKYRWSFLPIIIFTTCVTLLWTLLPGNALPVLALLHPPQAQLPVIKAVIEVEKPTYTPTSTSTSTPTSTFTPTATYTLTPSPTETSTPTATFTSTHTPWPTDTPIPWPTNTPIPEVTQDTSSGAGGVHWIDVDLSEQRLYAYEGDTLVASFLVSTGVPAFPTVTGQYHVYMKLISTLMAGDGYYLPDVPYTMYFYKGYGIHGTYWHNNFGRPMSHGCVNMYTPDAEWMYYWTPVGTLVKVHY